MSSYSIQEVMICYDHYFDVQIVQHMASRSSFNLTLCLLDMSPSFFDHFLAFWHNIQSLFHPFFAPRRNSGFLVVGNGQCSGNRVLLLARFPTVVAVSF